jgi:hypothetical protein
MIVKRVLYMGVVFGGGVPMCLNANLISVC